MSHVSTRHVAIVLAVLLVVAAIGLWLWESAQTASETTPPPAPPAAAGKAVRVASPTPRRVRAADGVVPVKADVPAGPPAALVVRVVEGVNRAPLAGAAVYVIDAKSDDWRAESDTAGAARFEAIPAGRTEVRAEMDGRVAAERKLTFAVGANESVEIVLDAAVALEGSVVDARTGMALAGADVELIETLGSNPRSVDGTTTDSAGRFRFEKARASTVVLVKASLAGHGKSQRETVTPSPGGAGTRVELRLARTGSLRGFVRGPDGSAVYDGWVHVAIGPRSGGWDTVTGDDGSYTVQGVTLGMPFVVTAGAPEWADAEPVRDLVVDVATGEATLDLVLRRPTTLVVRVFDPAGQAVDAGLSLDGSMIQGGRWTKEHVFTRERVTPGRHVLRAEMPGWPPAEREVVLPEGERTEIEVRLDKGVTIAGVVVDESGNPVAGAQVWVSDADPSRALDAVAVATSMGRRRMVVGSGLRNSAASGTPPDGTFRIDGVSPGPHQIFVMVDGLVTAMPGAGPDGSAAERRRVEAPASDVRLVVGSSTRAQLRVLPRDAGLRSPRIVVRQGAIGAAANLPFEPDAESSLPYDFASWSSESTLRCAVEPGPSTLRLLVPGFAPVVLPMNAVAGTTTDLGEIQLDAGVTLSGRVVDAEGHPISGAGLVPLSGLGRGTVVTKSDGSFAVEHVAYGPAVLRAVAPSRSGAVFVAAAESAGVVTIVLRPDGVLRGTVVDAAGAPMPGARVSIRHGIVSGASDPGRPSRVTTRDDGSFEWPVACGPYRVSAGGAWVDATVPEGGEARVTVVGQKR